MTLHIIDYDVTKYKPWRHETSESYNSACEYK